MDERMAATARGSCRGGPFVMPNMSLFIFSFLLVFLCVCVWFPCFLWFWIRWLSELSVLGGVERRGRKRGRVIE